MKVRLLTLCLFCIGTFSQAQKLSLSNFKQMSMRSIGPAGMSGRVTAVDALNTNPNLIYLGTASGGVWKSENGGSSWQPVFDEQPILNIGAIAIQQSNPSVVWVGTGEGNPRNSINLGEGIYKSLDGGKTWKLMGLENTRNIHRVIVDPTNPNTVYVGAIGNPYTPHPERGVYKTTDGGETWKQILHTNDTTGCADLIMDPSNPNKLFANLWQHQRTPFSFSSGGNGSGFYVTYDGGKNWKKLGKPEGLPEGDYGRIGISICYNQPSRVYAMIEATKNGLYKSDDGGASWELVNSTPKDVTNRPFYFQDIKVDPVNESRLYNINQMIHLSEDGGKSFKTIIPYSGIHPDHHAFWINPLDANLIIEGNDGGIGISRDRGKTWKFDDQLPVGQFYHINVDNETPYHVMGGMQDNGSWRGPGYSWHQDGMRNYHWQSLWGGDGFDVSPDPENSNWIYAMSQGGGFGKYNVVTGEHMSLQPPIPDLKTRLRFNWNAAFAQDPINPGTVYYGSQFVHKSTNRGLNWTIISPDLTTNDSTQQKQDVNGGLSIDITNAENYNTILCIEPSSKNNNIIWVGTDDGNIQLSKDGGKTWKNFRGKIPGMPLGAWVAQIKASKYNAAEAFVVCNDYRRGDMKPYIFRTKNYGENWERIGDEKKLKGYALCLIQDPVEPNLIFVGTEQGLWVSLDGGLNFEQWKKDYPAVSTYDLAIQEREADLCIATFGRALYILDDIKPLRKAATNKGNVYNKPVTVFDPPIGWQVNFKNKIGYDYSSWGLYEGQNKRRGVAIAFYIQPEKISDKKIKLDSAIIKIYTKSGELIRTMKAKIDSGLNRVYWGFEMKGIRQPGSPKLKDGSAEPTGINVFPGIYKVVVQQGKNYDSTSLVVMSDPKIETSKLIYDAKLLALKQLEKSTLTLTAITDQLSDAEETIAKVESLYKNVESKEADSLRKLSKSMTDSIKQIRYLIFGKPQEKQGYGSPYQITANGRIQAAISEIVGKMKIPDEQEYGLVKMAEELVANVVNRTNLFLLSSWKNYQSLVEAQPIQLFKAQKNIE